MSLEDPASDWFSEDVASLERSFNESDGYAFSLANFLTDQLVLCVPMLLWIAR